MGSLKLLLDLLFALGLVAVRLYRLTFRVKPGPTPGPVAPPRPRRPWFPRRRD